MSGGAWLSQNKIRPGAYINFKAVKKSSMTVGDRGIVAIPLELDWGAEGKLIEVLSSDLLNGNSRKLVGFTAFDSGCKLLAGALNYCYKALVYRTNGGGTRATATIENLTVTAKYAGTYGNKIVIKITEDTENELFNVLTYVDGTLVDSQKVATIGKLEDNDFVSFEGTALSEDTGTALTGGTNGTVSETVSYPAFLNLLKMTKWQTLACLSSTDTTKANVVSFIKNLREDEGRYVQGVVADYEGADYEGIINSISGAIINNVSYSKEDFVVIVAGMTAGANVNESNTAKTIDGATEIIGELTDQGIKNALLNGKFVLSTSTSGKIKVEQDINSLHTYGLDRNYSYSKNRVIRTLDEIGTTVKQTWEDTYMGKVDNNADGRASFKADIVNYATELQRINCIQEFTGSSDVSVEAGNNLDAVLVELSIKPVDSMEKLYITVNVNS